LPDRHAESPPVHAAVVVATAVETVEAKPAQLGDTESRDSEGPETATSTAAESPVTKDDLVNDPIVKRALEVFGGRIGGLEVRS
jgi:hypothetical protein